MSKYTIVNEEFLPAATASVLITDLAVQRGYGIFDFFKTIDGEPVFVEDHLDRFYNSAAAMRLPVDKSREELKSLLFTLIKKNGLLDSGIKITLTGGYSTDGYTLAKPNMIITQQPLTINKELNTRGIKLITHPHQRQLAEVKTLDYLMAIWLQPLIKQKGADDVLYHNHGMVKECPRANFFIVTQDNQVITSADKILKGIVRKQVLNLYIDGITIREKEISLEDLKQCKEAFITSSTKNILPVTEIDGQIIGNGHAGDVTIALAEKLKEFVFSK
ncbi:aminotransferase class IV [Mucilaginibacter sp.]|uniref:aminotransferase class IV n=1 Tax=Mucilaginibacter sp. TaxID=1882438 RepID=UPI002625BDB3|nr:aminotransferase class IV [Mucilaginibacter sp.]MDB4927293.1 amino acid aminotransferase [Mucilaginibacter sp.]